jgi:type II secretory pathway pseudopilin PulG
VASGQWSVASVSNPQSPIPNPHPRGFTLLEVLVSIGVLMLGLLGVAALIPIGKVAVSETNKADRTGACGRSSLRQIRIRRMLDPNTWWSTPTGRVYVIDPLGSTNSLTSPFGGTTSGTASMTVQRINLKPYPRAEMMMTRNQADEIFRWHDDLSFGDIETSRDRPTPPSAGAYEGSFSWLVTVAPYIVQNPSGTPLSTGQANVSAVVCWKRQFSAAENDPNSNETSVSVVCDSSPAYGGMGVQYPTQTSKRVVPKENEWVLLTSSNNNQASWYRVVAAGIQDDPDPSKSTTRVSLVGPDWYGKQGGTTGTPPTPDDTVKMIVVKGATGVYTTTVKLDDDVIWTR